MVFLEYHPALYPSRLKSQSGKAIRNLILPRRPQMGTMTMGRVSTWKQPK